MDVENSPARGTPASTGGTVEPIARARASKDLVQRPIGMPGERYEVRDAMTDLTYRFDRPEEAMAKADQVGGSRFVAIDAEGRRATVQRVNGQWQRGPQRSLAPERPLDPLPARDEVPDAASRESDSRARADGAPSADTRGGLDAKAVASLDAKVERSSLVARLEAALSERYVIKRAPVTLGDVTVGRTEYRFRGDTSRVAFTESTLRLATDTNSPSVARSMVDVAEARNWRALRVSGSEDFRRLVWLEASVRGVKTLGYEPNPADLEVLKRERESRLSNRIEPARDGAAEKAASAAPAEKGSARGSGGRKAVLAAIEAVLVSRRVPEKQREAVMAAATEKLAQRLRDGQSPKIKVYDKSAPSQRPIVVPMPEAQRARERAAPAPVR